MLSEVIWSSSFIASWHLTTNMQSVHSPNLPTFFLRYRIRIELDESNNLQIIRRANSKRTDQIKVGPTHVLCSVALVPLALKNLETQKKSFIKTHNSQLSLSIWTQQKTSKTINSLHLWTSCCFEDRQANETIHFRHNFFPFNLILYKFWWCTDMNKSNWWILNINLLSHTDWCVCVRAPGCTCTAGCHGDPFRLF